MRRIIIAAWYAFLLGLAAPAPAAVAHYSPPPLQWYTCQGAAPRGGGMWQWPAPHTVAATPPGLAPLVVGARAPATAASQGPTPATAALAACAMAA